MDIVTLERMGFPPEEMRTYHSSRPLTLAEVHAALTYYYDHRNEVHACLRRIASGTRGTRSGATTI
jgi:hypothetical protein